MVADDDFLRFSSSFLSSFFLAKFDKVEAKWFDDDDGRYKVASWWRIGGCTR